MWEDAPGDGLGAQLGSAEGGGPFVDLLGQLVDQPGSGLGGVP